MRTSERSCLKAMIRLSWLVFVVVLAVLPVLIKPSVSHAQISFGGLAELELRKGAPDSSPYLNQTPSDNWTLFTPRMRLIFSAELSRSWFIQGTLQADHYYSSELSEILLPMFNINWEPQQSGMLTLSAGSFQTPFGAYGDRVHRGVNRFVQLPQSYARGLPINRYSGLAAAEGTERYGLSLLYRRAYSQGIKVRLADDRHHSYDVRLAATLTPVSGYSSFEWKGMPSVTGRAEINPVIWLTTGLSFSHGSFMDPDDTTLSALPKVDFEQYTQSIIAADAEFSYAHFRVLMEAGWNRWQTPGPDEDQILVEGPFHADAWFGLTELQYNFSFLPGLYSAFRAEGIQPRELSEPAGTLYGDDVTGMTWATDTYRFEWVLGRRINRNVTIKASYLHTDNRNVELKDSVLALQLSVAY